MFPVINLKETGINLRRIMDKRGISVKEIQEFYPGKTAEEMFLDDND